MSRGTVRAIAQRPAGDLGRPAPAAAAESRKPLLLIEKLVKEYPRQGATATLGKLFGPFVRGQDTGNQQGRGLGLFIVSQIASAHGGTIDVTSTDDETRFTFQMPLVLDERSRIATGPAIP